MSEPDYRAEMKLPEGKTCGECIYFGHCKGLFGCPPTNTSCDWHPSRFTQRCPTDIEVTDG